MTETSDRTFSSDFKRFFIRGLAVLLPSVLTLWLVSAAYRFVDDRIAQPINQGVRVVMNHTARYFEPLRDWYDPTESQLNAAVAERAVDRGVISRQALRRELIQQFDPSEADLNALIAERVVGQGLISRGEVRDTLREQLEMDPTEAQVDAAITERAVDEGWVSLDRMRRELVQQFDPTDDQINTAIAARVAEDRTISIEAVRFDLRQRTINEWWAERAWYMNLLGLVIAIITVYMAGRLVGGFLGRHIYLRLERLITSLPIFKQVYPYVKQIVDFLFSDEQPIKFNRVVVTEYPRKGIWSLGFHTGQTLKAVAEYSGDAVTIFIPSSPTPFTGYTITVPRKDVIEVPISVDEAIRFAVSGGVLVPDHQTIVEDAVAEKHRADGRPLEEPITVRQPAAPALPAGEESSDDREASPTNEASGKDAEAERESADSPDDRGSGGTARGGGKGRRSRAKRGRARKGQSGAKRGGAG